MSISVNYAALESANSQMQSIARQMDERLDSLRSRLQRMQWEGSDQEAYNAHQASWDAAVRDMNSVLNEIGAAVGVARENYMSTEMNNAKAWS